MFINGKVQPWYIRAVDVLEKAVKGTMFDCSDCGQCILRSTGMVCSMRCPKQMRNGPCGGAMNGKCEVHPDHPCIWHLVYERANRLGMEDKLDQINPPVDWRLWGTPSWVHLLTGRITRNGHAVPPKEEMPTAGLGSVAKKS